MPTSLLASPQPTDTPRAFRSGWALVDTGLQYSCVQQSVVDDLDLAPLDELSAVNDVFGFHGDGRRYLAEIVFEPGKTATLQLVAVDMPNVDAIAVVGRDLLCTGRFSYDGATQTFTFAFDPDAQLR